MPTKTYTIVGSDGQLETYGDPYADIKPEDHAVAQQAQMEIMAILGNLQTEYIRLGAKLSEFEQKKLYLALGYPTFKDWLADPEVNIGSRVAHDLIRIVREAIPVLAKNNAMDALPRVSTMRSLLPVLNEGEEEFVEMVKGVKDLPVRDVYEKIREHRGLTNSERYVKGFLHKGSKEAHIELMMIGDEFSYKLGKLTVKMEDLPELLKAFSSKIHIDDTPTS